MIGAGISIILVFVFSLMVYVSFNKVAEENERELSAQEIHKTISELDIVTYEYLTYREERMLQQWDSRYAATAEIIEKLAEEEWEVIKSNYADLKSLFSKVTANYEKQGSSELEERLVAQFLIKSQVIISSCSAIAKEAYNNAIEAQVAANHSMMSAFIVLFVVLVGLSFHTARRITNPLNKLIRGTEIIGKGNLKHRVDIKTKSEIGGLAVAFNQMTENLKKVTASRDELNKEIIERKKAEEELKHINLVLRAVRGVNQGIVKEKDQVKLIKLICDILAENRSYYNSWFALLDESGKLIEVAETGLGKNFTPVIERLKNGKLPRCAQKALSQQDIVITKDPFSECIECPLSGMYGGRAEMTIRLEHEGKVYGLFVASISSEFIEDKEEQSLFKEVAGDIAFALHSIETEKKRKKAEQDLEDLNKQLQATVEKLTLANRELQHFAHIAAHDLKAPLRAIGTLADWISTDYADKFDEEGKREVELLVGRVARMSDMIDSILRYSEAGRVIKEKEKVNLNALIEEVIAGIAPPENISVTVENELPVLEGEKTHFMQVFQNLLSNAVKYMDKPIGQIKVGCTEENGFWKFSVADNGPGVEKEYFERIFEMFQTLLPRDEFEATGVGLSVVKKIVELYGGSVWIESEFGKGSVFFFTLPNQEMKVADDAKLKANIVS